jgi:hypothetical protein
VVFIYDAGYVKANSIARQPFGLGKTDRGQNLLFHEFIQSWVGYELVKVLVTFGLQPTCLNSSLKEWSQDLPDIFMYMQTKKPELKGRATEILDVLFNNTVHSGHWSHVQFGMKKKIFQRNNSILSLVILTWLQQLQQFFLNEEKKDKNGDWNNFGKYTGTTTNNLKDTTPLANMNFSSVSTPNVLTQSTKIKQFKPFEEIKGVCTSLEEWAIRILKPDQEFQLEELYDNDPETAQHWDRVMGEKKRTPFKITTKIFTAAKDNIRSRKQGDTDGTSNIVLPCPSS